MLATGVLAMLYCYGRTCALLLLMDGVWTTGATRGEMDL
jgi:hypothetical protein